MKTDIMGFVWVNSMLPLKSDPVRLFRTITTSFLGLVIIHVVLNLVLTLPLPLKALLNDLLLFIAIAIAALCLYHATRRSAGLGRRIQAGWLWLAVAFTVYMVADAVQLILDVSSVDSVPSAADILFMLVYPLLIVGVALLSGDHSNMASRIKLAIDIAVVTIATFLVVWVFVFAPLVAAYQNVDLATRIFALLYLALDLILFLVSLRLFFRRFDLFYQRPIGFLLAGAITQIISETVISSQSLDGTFQPGGLPDTVLVIACGLVGMAGVAQVLEANQRTKSAVRQSPLGNREFSWTRFVPFLAIAAVYPLIFWHDDYLAYTSFQAIAFSVGVIICLTLIRQAISFAESRKLYVAAQQEIAERKQAEKSLRLLEKALETMNLGVTIADSDNQIIYVNPAEARMHGYTVQELIGKPRQIFAASDPTNPMVPDQMKNWGTWQREGWNIRKDKSIFPVYLFSDIVFDAERNPIAIVTSCLDITERRKIEQALQRSKEDLQVRIQERTAELAAARARLEHLLAASPIIIYSSQAKSPYAPTFISDNVYDLLGYQPEEFIQKPEFWIDNIHPADVEHVVRDMTSLFIAEQNVSEYRFKDAYSRYRWMRDITRLIHDDSGAALEIVGAWMDITQERQAAQDLRIKDAAITSSTNPIALMDLNGDLIYANPAFFTLWGVTQEEIIGTNLSAFWQMPLDASLVLRVLIAQGSWSGELAARKKDGTSLIVQLAASLVKAVTGEPLCIMASFIDVTESRRAEERQRVMYETLCAVSGQLDRDTIARTAAETIARQTNYPHICIALPDESHSYWTICGAAGELAATLGVKYAMDKGVIGRTFTTAQLQWIKDVRQSDHYLIDVVSMGQRQLLSEVAAPIQRGGRLLGVLNIESMQVDGFDQNDVLMIQSLAEILALALDNAQLYREAALSEKRFRAIFEQVGDGIIITDTTTKIINSNPAMQEFVGYTNAELQAIGLAPITLPEDALKDRSLARELLAGKRTSYHVEKRYLRKDGQVAWGRATVSLIRDISDQSIYGIGVIEDITERKRAEEQLRKLSIVVEQSPSSIVITDPAANIEYVNPRFTQLTGYTPAEVIGKNPRIFQSGQTPLMVYVKLWGTLTAGNAWQGELIDRKKNGEVFFQLANISPITDSEGKVTHYVALAQDITEHKRLEQSIAHNASTMQLLYDTSLEVNAQSDLSVLLQTIIRRATEFLDADVGSLHLVDVRQQAVRLVVGHNLPNLAAIGTSVRFGEEVAGRTAQIGKPVLIADYEHWHDQSQLYIKLGAKRVMGMPLLVHQTCIGVIVLVDSKNASLFTPEQIRLVRLFADQAAIAIERAQLHDELAQLAITDELTGLYNRRGLFQMGEREAERALRFNRPLSVIFFDIDHFREFNNSYGHAVGDQVLQRVAQLARYQARHLDIVGRYGGEEFVWLLPETDKATAAKAAERFRQSIEVMAIPFEERTLHVSISLGVAQATEHTLDLAGLINNADYAMLRAKSRGRNRVEIEN